jgi:hypothetical protein
MIFPRSTTAIAATVIALLISACGGDAGTEPSTAAKTPTAVAARANAICREFRRETSQIGKAVPGNLPPGTLALTTELLVKPSIPVLERVANRLHALEPETGDPNFALYAGLYDPIVVLAQKRLAAGEAGDASASDGFDAMLTDFGVEQQRVARLAGLRGCDVDFERVLVSSLTE